MEVFNFMPYTYYTRMTGVERRKIIRHAFLAAGIYRRSCHLRCFPRFFAGAQNDQSWKVKESFGTLSGLPVCTGASITYDAYQDSSLTLRMTGPGNGAKDTKPEA